jgi:hypothetical protein
MKILFLLRSGVIEWEVPAALEPSFHFSQMATQVRMAGYFMADNLYIRHDELIGISVAGDGPVYKPPGATMQ